MEIIENFPDILISLLLSPPTSGWFFALKAVFISFSLALLGFIIFALSKTTWLSLRYLNDLNEFLTYRPFMVRKVEKDWKKIMARLNTALESEYKLAVIEADNMMDEILKKTGYPGESLGERLKELNQTVLPNLEEVKEAHQVRNHIIHDPNYRLPLDQAKRVLKIFEKAFDDFGAF